MSTSFMERAKHLRLLNIANNSNILMWSIFSDFDHQPFVEMLLEFAPQPSKKASVNIIRSKES